MNGQCVYVAWGAGIVKVGRTKSLRQRKPGLQSSFASKGLIFGGLESIGPAKYAAVVEPLLHEYMAKKFQRHSGREWFLCEDKDQCIADIRDLLPFLDAKGFLGADLASGGSLNTDEAIKLAGGREQLAKLLGAATISTYRWKPNLPQARADRLRILKPSWFRKPKEQK